MNYSRPSLIHYRTAQAISWLVSKVVFRRKILRNEIRGVKGPFVVIANHQAAYDFVNLIGATSRPMSFVISNAFYSTLPIKGFLDKMGVIPKQQFQTTLADMRAMRAVVESGEPLVIYPAGLMCEDGLSSPIPAATYKFLKWLEVDVYVARSTGTYFSMPKWSEGMRPGNTYIDIYRLFTKEELGKISVDEIRKKTDEALLFDAYREQESAPKSHRGSRDIEGFENVLYKCPQCGEEFTVNVRDKNIIFCEKCGFEQISDERGLMTLRRGEKEIRYPSDWSRLIYDDLKAKIRRGEENELSLKAEIRMIDPEKNRFVPVGSAAVKLTAEGFTLAGEIRGEETEISVSVKNVPTLPFTPGKYFEIQSGKTIYRCLPENRRAVMKIVNMVKIFCELDAEDKAQAKHTSLREEERK